MYEMVMGYMLFYSENRGKLFKSIICDELHYSFSLRKKAINILKAFLRKNPKTQLGCLTSQGQEETIKVHPFFKDVN